MNTPINNSAPDVSTDERLGLPSASHWYRYERCPGSYQLSLEARKRGQAAFEHDKYAQSGTRVHAALEGQEDIELTYKEQVSVDILEERANDMLTRIFGGQTPDKVLLEHRVWIYSHNRPVASGKADRIVICGNTACVQDYKPGFREPDPAGSNAQLKILAVGVALLKEFQIDGVWVQVICGPYPPSEHYYDTLALAKAWKEIMTTLQLVNDPRAKLNPSLDACRYCPAIMICQPVRDKLGPLTRLQTSFLPDGERAGKLLDECTLMLALVKQIREHYSAKLGAEKSYRIPNWSLEPGNGRRELVNAQEAAIKLAEAGIDSGDLGRLCGYSVPELEGLVASHWKLKKQDAAKKLKLILGDTLIYKEGKLGLKRVGAIK